MHRGIDGVPGIGPICLVQAPGTGAGGVPAMPGVQVISVPSMLGTYYGRLVASSRENCEQMERGRHA